MLGAISSLSLILVASPLIARRTVFHLPVYSLGLIVNSIVGFALIPRIGVSGAVWGTLLGETVILLGWMGTGRWILRNLRLEMLFSMSLLVVALAVHTVHTSVFRKRSRSGVSDTLADNGSFGCGAFSCACAERVDSRSFRRLKEVVGMDGNERM